MQNLEQLFEETLRDIYYAEKAILKALPKMAKKASSSELSSAFEEHMGQTEDQVARLEQIFEMMNRSARGKRCPAIDGLAEEASEIMQEAETGTVRDAGMLAAAQAVEHYGLTLWHAGGLGRQARHEGSRSTSAHNAAGGKGYRRQTDGTGPVGDQHRSRR